VTEIGSFLFFVTLTKVAKASKKSVASTDIFTKNIRQCKRDFTVVIVIHVTVFILGLGGTGVPRILLVKWAGCQSLLAK